MFTDNVTFFTFLTVLVMVGYLYYVLVPDQNLEKGSHSGRSDPLNFKNGSVTDNSDEVLVATPEATGVKPLPRGQIFTAAVAAAELKTSWRNLRDRLALAEAAASRESSSESSRGISNKLKTLIRELVSYTSSVLPPMHLEHEVLKILDEDGENSALDDRRLRYGIYQRNVVNQVSMLESATMTHARSESVCLPAFRKYVDKTCRKYQERYGRPAYSCESWVSMTEFYCSGDDS